MIPTMSVVKDALKKLRVGGQPIPAGTLLLNRVAVEVLSGHDARVLIVRGADDFAAAEEMINRPTNPSPVAIFGVVGAGASIMAPLKERWPTQRRCAVVIDSSQDSSEFARALFLTIPNLSGQKITLRAINGKPCGLAYYVKREPRSLGLWVPWWTP